MDQRTPIPGAALRRCAALLLLVVAAGCSAPAHWQTIGSKRPFGALWTEFVEVARSQGYRAEPLETDRGRRVYLSKWRTREGAFRTARRSRLHGRFERDPDDPERWLLEFHVELQEVTAVGGGLDAEERDWSDAGQYGAMEERLIGMLHLRLGEELGVEPSYRRGS